MIVYSRDHWPPHVHVVPPRGQAKILIDGPDAQPASTKVTSTHETCHIDRILASSAASRPAGVRRIAGAAGRVAAT